MKFKLGILLATVAMGGMILGLVNNTLARVEKSGIVIFCFLIMLFGVLIETPLVRNIREVIEVEGTPGKPPEGWKAD